MCRSVSWSCVFFIFLGFFNSQGAGDSCQKVKDEFTKISGEDLVPDMPTIGELLITPSRVDLSISCQSADQRAASGNIKRELLIRFN